MNRPREVVAGAFAELAPLEAAVADLRAAGFGREQIGLAVRGGDGRAVGRRERRAASGAVAGGAVGALLAGAIGLVVVGPGGPLAGELLVTALGGVVGATAGGLVGALTRLGLPDEVHRNAGQIGPGAYLLLVRAGDRRAEVERFLRSHGARRPDGGELAAAPPFAEAAKPATGYGAGAADFGPGVGTYRGPLVPPPDEDERTGG